MSIRDELLRVDGLVKHFPVRGGALNRVVNHVQAVSDVSFTVRRGEVLGLVGESGSGKTTVGQLARRLLVESSAEALREQGAFAVVLTAIGTVQS